MTAHHVYELSCDAEGCEMFYASMDARADLTRAKAQEAGWVHGVAPPNPKKAGPYKSLDYCPAHAERLGELAPQTPSGRARVE